MAALLQVGLALLLVVTLAAGQEKCRTGCHGVTPNVFKFAEGTTYKYDLDGKVDLSLSSADGQHSTTKLKATVFLTQQGQCNQVLRLQNVQIFSPESKKYTNIDDIEKPIVLNFHDGHVEDIICTQPSDSQNSLNIKRAVASMFQAASKHHSYHGNEIDVFGDCPTQFSQKTQGDMQIITKTRNLNKCAHRESLRQDFMTTTFDPNSEIKSNPFLQGTYSAELKLKNGIPQLITVDEDYLYVPFSNGDKGAKANVHTQLKYLGIAKDNAKVHCTVPKSILFEDPHPVSADKSCVGPILKSIKETANAITVNVKEDTASKFNYLRKSMRSATKKDLLAVYSQVRAGAGFTNKDVGRRVFLDALFRTRTGESVEVAIDIYKSNSLSPIESKIFFASLNFVEHVTEGALSAAGNLISSSPVPREGYLGIGALARKYCRQHSCDNVKPLNNLLSALQSKLTSRPTNRDSENNVLSVLKAVRNAGHVTNPLAGKVIEIAQDKQAPARLRVGALEAYLAAPCNDRYRDSAIAILKDVQLDSEIRVKAYLALAECPNGKVATAVKNLIDNEPSIQVGGFIVSHLATLRSSTNRDKLLAKAQLGGIRTTKRYPLDFRQYSFNGEYSTYSSLGFAESIEGNVIYSQSSFLPRSVSVNMSVEWFGNNVNVLEVNARQENLDGLLASYFGPNGEFTTAKAEDNIKGTAKFANTSMKIVSKLKSYKHKREVSKAQLENFSKQLADKQNPLNKDLDLDLSVKLFGSELVFYSLHDDIKEYDVDHVVDSVINTMDDTENLFDDFDRSYTANLMFLDSEVSYPTSTGFPLRLGLEGTASSHIKAATHLPDTDDFKFSLIPSISAEVKAQFIVDAAVIESGLTVVGNLYSSIGGAVEASYTTQSFDYKFLLPIEKQEILTVTHNIMFETREPCGAVTKTPLKFIQGKDFSICLDQLKSYVGLTFCADVNQPDVGEDSANVLPYPFNGNSKLSITILKDDFGYIRVHEKTVPARPFEGFQGAIELVDTKNTVKTSFKYDISLSTPSITFELQSPEIKGIFETRIVSSQTEGYGLVRLAFNDLEYYAKLGLSRTLAPDKRIYTPIMEYKVGQPPAQPFPYHVTGQIIEVETAEQNKFTFANVKLISPDKPPIAVLGSFTLSRNDLSVDITLDEGHHKGSLKGKVVMDRPTISVNAQFTNSFNPDVNFDLKYTLKFIDIVNMESNLQFIHGSDLSNKNAVLKLFQGISYANKGDDSEFETEHVLVYPGLGLDNKFKLKLKKKYLDLGLQLGYNKIKVGTELEILLDKKSNGDIDVEFELFGFDNKLELEIEREVQGHKSKVHHKLAVNGYSIEVKGEVKHFIEQQRGDLGQDLVIKITSKPDIKVKTELKYTPNDIDTSAKITYGGDMILEGFLKGSRVGSVNGNLKANIPGHLTANGNVKANKGTGTANLLVNFQQLQRKFKTDVQFATTEPHYKLDVTLYTNFEKDNSRKYRLVTDNEYHPQTSLDSKNLLDILGQKTVFNIKLSAKGDITEMEEGLDTELILPNEQYFAAKFHRNHKKTNNVINGQSYLTLEQRSNKNASGKTLTLKEVAKNVNINDRTFDLSYSLGLDDGAGHTLNGELGLKKSRSDGEGHIDYSGKLYGSTLSETLQANIISKYKGSKADYKLSSSYGKGITFNVKGKHDIQPLESHQPSSLDLSVDILTPNSVIKVIKYSIQGSGTLPTADDESTDLKVATSLFIDDDGKEQGATVDFKYDGAYTHKKNQGSSTQSFTIQNQDPIVIASDYKYDDTKVSGDVSVKYSKNKEVKVYGQFEAPNDKTLKFDVQLETPIEKARKIRLDGFLSESEVFFKSEATLTVDDVKYVEKVNIDIASDQPSYNIELVYPTGKVDKLYAKLLRNDDDGFAFEEKIILHMYDFTLDTAGDIKIKKFDDFNIKLSADSPKLKLDKISLKLVTQDVGGSKKLILNVKQANTPIVDGSFSTTYKYHADEGKIIIDGSGTLTVNNQKKSGNFKILYRDLDLKRDKEDGLQITVNSVIGNKAFDIEYILTDTHFKYLTSYCVEKKECAHVEVEAKEVSDDVDILVVNLDLRPLGVSHEFGLKSETNSKNLKHTLDVHLVSNEFKYQYNVLILPTQSHFTLTTPKRIISLESEIHPSKNKGPIKGSIVLYTNKKLKPQDKTELQFQLDGARNYVNFNAKLTAPPLRKPLTVSSKYNEGKGEAYSYELVLDILPNSDKKIIVGGSTSIEQKDDSITTTEKYLLDLQPINYKLNEESRSFANYKTYETDFEYAMVETYRNKPVRSGYSLKFNKNSAQTKFVLYNKVIFDITSTAKFSKEYSVIDSECKIIGCDPITSRLELKNGNAVRYVLHKTAAPQTRLELNSGLILGAIADFRVDLHKENKKIGLVHGSIKLDESDFGKSEYALNSNDIRQHIITPMSDLSKSVAAASTDHFNSIVSETKKELQVISQTAQTNKPSLTPILSYYEGEAKAIREELITDESLKQFAESLGNILSAIVTVTVDLIRTLAETSEKFILAAHQQSINLVDLLATDIIPKVQELVIAIGEKAVSVFESATDLCFGLLQQVTSFFDSHQNELKQIATALSQLSKDIITFIQKVNEELVLLVRSEISRISHELPTLQNFDAVVKDILTNKTYTEETLAVFLAQAEALKDTVKLEKFNRFVDLTVSYVEKKVNKQKCDDSKEISAIISAGIAAIQEIFEAFIPVDREDLDFTLFDIPIPSKLLNTLPEAIETQVSLLNRIINKDIPTLGQLYSWTTLNPEQFIPPFRKYAIIAQGQHIFTFDGKHLTFPGKCPYLLAKDAVNNEFSIVGVYLNGALSELTFADKADTITLKKSGAASLNGAPTEFPIRGKKTEAFRTYHEVHLKSTTGVNIYCQPDLSLCMFSVSGYYHGQLRGILGNANAEPFDDYTTVKGAVVTSESDFANSYKIGNCPAVKTVDHHTHTHAESCTKLFSELSEMAFCYPFVNPANFRQACDHGVAAEVPHTEKMIAAAYVLACKSKYIPIFLPSQYVKCENCETPRELYDMFSVKLPQKAADIVFAIDASEDNENYYKELIQVVGTSLIKDLAEKGIKDIEYHVLTFGGNHPDWPSHITTNGGKMTFKGKMPNLKFSKPIEEDDLDFGHETVNFIISLADNYINQLALALGFDSQSRAYLEAIDYPFRTHATKAIIAMSSAPCEKTESYLLHLVQKLRAALVQQATVHINLITPLTDECDFKVKDDKTTKNVVGFNSNGVFTFADAKKKTGGNPDLLKDLSYDDFCSEYTVMAGGNVFVLDNFAKNKKQFATITSHVIADSLVSTEQGLDCACMRDGLLTAKNVCVQTYSKDKSSSKKLLKG